MNKICTSIEQSKKLLELGIDVNTADMRYHTISPYDPYPCDEIVYTIDFGKPSGKEDISCWSLSALLKLIKSEIYGKTIYGDIITYKVDFRKYKFTDDVDLYQIAYGSIKFDVDGQHSFKDMVNTGQKEDPIDAAFQMVVLLKENNLL